MSTTFIDGPAKGVTLELARAPLFLRVVHDQKTWQWDALDQLDDTPQATETIWVYQFVRETGRGFACSRGKGCRPFVSNEYRLYAQQPDQETLRDDWTAWCQAEYERTQPGQKAETSGIET